MIVVHFNKQFAETFLDAISTGKPIPAPADGWTGQHMLTLAGMLYAAVFSQGPHALQATSGGDRERLNKALAKLKSLHPEKLEAVEEEFNEDIHDGIEFLSHLLCAVKDGEYDKGFEPEATGIVYRREKGQRTLHTVQGFRKHKG
jgi:hypothetical protein